MNNLFSYYTSIILLSFLSLGILCILVHENSQISKSDKHMYYITYIVIGVSALAEWTGNQMNGNESINPNLLRFVKCCDYILTPAAGGALIAQMKLHNRWTKVLIGILIANTVFQCISFFTDWMIIIDASNHYRHGSLYVVYMLIYLAIIAIVVIQSLNYGRSFRRQNKFSLYSIIAMVILGISMQEIFGGDIKTSYISLTIGAILMFIHFTDFSQQTSEEHIIEQQIQISTDVLTGLLSRHAYSQALAAFSENVPAKLAAFSIDINGLKKTNDTLGHKAGDELICGAADCILKVFGDKGKCFRTGGDEFIVLTEADRAQADELLLKLENETKRWRGKEVKSLSLSAGYALAADHEGCSCEMLVREADMKMYDEKRAYYQANGRDRRHTLR